MNTCGIVYYEVSFMSFGTSVFRYDSMVDQHKIYQALKINCLLSSRAINLEEVYTVWKH